MFSVACALAPTIEVLIAARALQGAAGALLTPSALAIIVAAFPAGQRAAAIGTWTAWGGIAAIVGPLLGGVIVDHASWRWIFAINVLPVAATLVLVLAAVPPTARVAGRQVDVVGALLCMLGLGGFVFALIEQPRYGWSSPLIWIPLAAGVAIFAAFLVYERRTAEPMLKLELFSRRNFAVGNVETLSMYAGVAILFFFLVIYLQEVAGYTAVESGLTTRAGDDRDVRALAPLRRARRPPRAAAVHGRRAARRRRRASCSCCGWACTPRTSRDLLPALLLFAVGLTVTVAPLTATVLADADETDAGIASAINNAVARVAGLIGVSLVGVVVAGALTGDTFAPNAESVHAFHVAMAICAALVAAGGVAGLVGIVNPRRPVKAEQCAGRPTRGRARARRRGVLTSDL